MPFGGALAGSLAFEEEEPGLDVEIEAAEEEDDVVEVGLVGDEDLGDFVISQESFVVGGEDVAKEAVVDGQEGEVLIVGIMFGRVSYDVMDVVTAFPPA